MSATRPALLFVLAVALPAVDGSEVDFGLQPVAIGAGPRALGMGGAFSAIADDATAVTWNPAGLTQCERPEAAISLGWYRSDVRGREGWSGNEDADLDHASALLPFFAFGCQQAVGLAWQRQYDFSRSLQSQTDYLTGPIQVLSEKDFTSSGSYASLGLSYAIEPHPGISLGVTVNAWDDALTGASRFRTDTWSSTQVTIGASTTLTEFDTTAEVRVVSGLNLVAGAFWQAAPALTLALVVKPTYTLEVERAAQVHQVTDSGGGPVVTDYASTTRATLRYPSSLTLGAAWRHDDRHTLSCDATVTDWSQYRIDDDVARSSPLSVHLDAEEFGPLLTLRLGYEHVAILPRVFLVPRVGLLLEDLPAVTAATSSATPDEVDATFDRWWGVTAGLSLCRPNWIWDIGAQVRYGHDVGAGQQAPDDQDVDMLVTTLRLGVTVQF